MRYVLVVSLLVVFFSCKKDTENIEPSSKLTFIATYAQNTIKLSLAAVSGFLNTNGVENKLKNDVHAFKMEYTTKNVDNKDITVSGLLLVPKTSNAVGVIVLNHGTVTYNDRNSSTSVPSLISPSISVNNAASESLMGVLLASLGNVVLMPDYIGYGSSNNVNHPYMNAQFSASTVYDMIKYYFNEHQSRFNINFNKNLQLLGYSEGGFVSLAAHKYIQENNLLKDNISSSSPTSLIGGTPAMPSVLLDTIVNSTTQMFYLPVYLWVFASYNKIYNLNAVPSDIFSLSSITSLDVFEGGTYYLTSSQTIPKNIFTPNAITFLTNPTNDNSIYARVKNAFKANDLDGWTPANKITFVHSTDDDFVFYSNIKKTYDNMKARGSGDKVVLTSVSGYSHGSGFFPYLAEILKQF